MTAEERSCRNCKTGFGIEPDDFAFYDKIGVPPPTLCPSCRFQRRLLFRNERNFHRRKCDLCQRDMIACYPADFPAPVYCQKCWWSDKWDPYQYGRDFDFSRPFFEQFQEFLLTVPMIAIMNDDGVASVNCEYSYDWAYSKNCYLCVCGWHAENVMYSYHSDYAKDIVDALHCDNSERMYECAMCYRSAGCRYCALCFDSRDCTLSYDLRNCSDCILCVGLRNKQYCIRNEQYPREEYLKRVQEMQLGDRDAVKQYTEELEAMKLRFPRKFAHHHKCVNSTGDILFNSKMARDCFYASAENSRYAVVIDDIHDCYDCNNTGKANLCYESVTPDESYDCKTTIFCWKCTAVDYSYYCQSAENCFGCSALKKGSYSILNKRYSEEEYSELKARIVEQMQKTGEWGEFFPKRLSPFAYNDTAAMEWFTLTRSEAEARGFSWREPEARDYKATMTPETLPRTIAEAEDFILQDIIQCAHQGECNQKCTTAFKITAPELQFYRKADVPPPDLCPNCRHYERLKKRNPTNLWRRKCGCAGAASENGIFRNTATHFHSGGPCPNNFETPYAPERPEIVYCEQCYNSEIA